VLALIAAFVAGVIAALIYAVLTVTFLADQNVSGLTLTIFGIGLANFIGIYMLGASENGTLKLPEGIAVQMNNIHIPGLSDIPVVGQLIFSYSPFVYLGVVIAILAGLFLKKTKLGLNVQAIGHNPAAADAAGINVTRWKYVSSARRRYLHGIGGACCAMIISGVWITITSAVWAGLPLRSYLLKVNPLSILGSLYSAHCACSNTTCPSR
ncbi:MAG: ABC transporter permease subunit, partial [Escherichia coli]